MFRLSLSLVLACTSAQAVFGQGSSSPEHERWEVSWFGGGSFVGKLEFPTPILGNGTSQTVGMHYGSGYELGLRVNENLGNFLAADLEYSLANQPLTFNNLSPNIQS